MDERERIIRIKMRDDFLVYAARNLKIRAKKADTDKGKIIPLVLNAAQTYIHEQIEGQRARTGRVRALILKGRQQGCSTYVGGRFYWKTTHRRGFKTFILTHRDDATENLFRMTKRFHEMSNPLVKPSTSFSNRKELVFDKLDCAYGLGTAKSGAVGRSDTIDLFHGSEVAFWENTDDIRTGVMQAANEAEEIILESTANGFDPLFHPMWQSAVAGLSEYIAIFVPWFWQSEYEIDVPSDFALTPIESELLEIYGKQGLTVKNLAWRRAKLSSDFSGDEVLFKQEYPCSPAEAFQVTGIESFNRPDKVLAARKRTGIKPTGAHIVGLDPARGGDRTAFMHRQGRVAWKGKVYLTPDTTAIKGEVRRLFEDPDDPKNPVAWLVIDIGGLGGPLYDDLRSMPFGDRIIAVNYGSPDVYKPERYKNKKAEMWGECRDWLYSTEMPVQIPDCDALQADACAPSYSYDHLQRVSIESKESLKKRGAPSPDMWEALCNTFARPFNSGVKKFTRQSVGGGSRWAN